MKWNCCSNGVFPKNIRSQVLGAELVDGEWRYECVRWLEWYWTGEHINPTHWADIDMPPKLEEVAPATL